MRIEFMKLDTCIACTTGALYFAYVTESDATEGQMVYKRIVTNPHLDQSQGTSYTRLGVRAVDGRIVSLFCRSTAIHSSLNPSHFLWLTFMLLFYRARATRTRSS